MSVAEPIAAPAARPAPLSSSERLARLRLARSVNVGPRTYAYLLRRYGTAERALEALPSLADAGGKSGYVPCPLADAEAEIEAGQAAGAVMILFLFIIALLGGKKEQREGSLEKLMALNFVGLLFAELLMIATVGSTKTLQGKFPGGSLDHEVLANVGSAKAIGLKLFTQHLIAFELASILLLVAAVGVICLAKFEFRPIRRRTR